MTRIPEIMYSWIDAHPKDGGFDRRFARANEVVVEIQKRGGDLDEIVKHIDPDIIHKVAKALGVGVHAGHVSASSMAAVVMAAAAARSEK